MAMTSRSIRREDLKRGDEVYLLVRLDKDGDMLKRKKARVVDVLRAAVVVDQIEGERGAKTVRFNELELVDPTAPPPPAIVRRRPADDSQQADLRVVPPAFEGLDKRPHVVRRQKPADAGAGRQGPVAEKPAERPKSVAPPPAAPSPVDVHGWIAQGAALREQVNEQVRGIKIQLDELVARQMEIEEQIAERKRELAKAETLLATLDQLGSVAR